MARSTRVKKTSSTKFKWTKELIIFLSVLCLAIILTIVCLIPTKKEKFYSEFSDAATAASATALPEDHVFSYISYKDLLKKKRNADEESPLFVLYGSANDSTTISNISNLNTKADDYGVEHIYILKCDFAMKTDTDDKDELKFVEDREEELGVEDLFTYCQLWVFENDKLVFNSYDVLEDDGVETAPDFAFAVYKCFSQYSPKALELKSTKEN